MRGKLFNSRVSSWVKRNIPAYAGKTRLYSLCLNIPGEHPRVCGENVQFLLETLRKTGTSPRMRGKLNGTGESAGLGRNIPAYAGKTVISPAPTNSAKEHPRVCGENSVH